MKKPQKIYIIALISIVVAFGLLMLAGVLGAFDIVHTFFTPQMVSVYVLIVVGAICGAILLWRNKKDE